MQVSGPVRAGLDEALAELHLPQVGPNTGERTGADRRFTHDPLQTVCALFATDYAISEHALGRECQGLSGIGRAVAFERPAPESLPPEATISLGSPRSGPSRVGLPVLGQRLRLSSRGVGRAGGRCSA